MKTLTLILISLVSLNLFAADQEWIAINSAHPLWDVFDVPVKTKTNGAFEVEEKRVGEIVCTKTRLTTGDDNPMLPRQVQTHCVFPAKVSAVDATAFYKTLKAEVIDTSGAYTEVKVVDRLIAVLDDDNGEDSRIYIEHDCRQVLNKSDANRCFKFWANTILPSFEEPNDTRLVELSPLNLKRAEQALDWMHGGEYAAAGKKTLATSDYLGLFQEHADEHHLRYYAMSNGENVIPQEVFDSNEADIEYTDVGEKVKTLKKEELDGFIKEVMKVLFMGIKPEVFGHYSERLEESLRYIHEENQE